MGTCSQEKNIVMVRTYSRVQFVAIHPMYGRGLMANKDVLHRSIGQAVGDGNSTYFWTDGWAVDKPLNEITVTPFPSAELALKVSAYWD